VIHVVMGEMVATLARADERAKRAFDNAARWNARKHRAQAVEANGADGGKLFYFSKAQVAGAVRLHL
jgi:hypothetical protein